ncbi:MAG: wcaJ 1 [Daejeonella sp.]|nr:wcaJ 1 [Daejeonella sp.]
MTPSQASNFSHNNITVAYTGLKFSGMISEHLNVSFDVQYLSSIAELSEYINNQSLLSLPDILIIEVDEKEECFELIQKIKSNALLRGIIIILFSGSASIELTKKAMSYKVHDLYSLPLPALNICERIHFLVKFKLTRPKLLELSKVDVSYKMNLLKRIFDILFAGLALVVLLPFLIIVAILIRLESRGPVIYKSKRVGMGYKTFNFYKFRSMNPDADKTLNDLATHNMYDNTEESKSIFIKIKADPRITKIGSIIRKTSIDELPQLFNVFRGDMSIVGNRPLPLYEAEMLTSNEWTMRFLGPAGLTGLWQISKRGNTDISEFERKRLDNFYAENHSFWLDMKIILKTIPALLQKDEV